LAHFPNAGFDTLLLDKPLLTDFVCGKVSGCAKLLNPVAINRRSIQDFGRNNEELADPNGQAQRYLQPGHPEPRGLGDDPHQFMQRNVWLIDAIVMLIARFQFLYGKADHIDHRV
jgi:hypothetical protein